jgi:hypothetical protein
MRVASGKGEVKRNQAQLRTASESPQLQLLVIRQVGNDRGAKPKMGFVERAKGTRSTAKWPQMAQ